jgi:hypothetical protein
MITCNRALMAYIHSMTTDEVIQSIGIIKNWLNSSTYKYDKKILINRLKNLEESINFEGENDL